jgi:hypothetical protein
LPFRLPERNAERTGDKKDEKWFENINEIPIRRRLTWKKKRILIR